MSGAYLWIYASGSGSDAADCEKSFDRYRAASGCELRVEALGADGAPSASRLPQVLWDASAGVPPKEIEALLARSSAGSGWCAGVRSADPREVRGLGRATAIWMKGAGQVRKFLGQVSDGRPPCLVLPRSEFDQHRSSLEPLPPDRWIRELLRSAARKGTRVPEAPVMWSVRSRRKV